VNYTNETGQWNEPQDASAKVRTIIRGIDAQSRRALPAGKVLSNFSQRALSN